MHTIRPLASDEHSAWKELVAGSPQAGLFQSLEWNQALCETSGRAESFLPIVCEHKGCLLGGIVLRYVERRGRKRADLPPFGYNGPVLAKSLGYSERCHTIPSYRVLEGLLVHVRETMACAVIHNQPELWDMRAFKYQDWKLETSYTHILHRRALDSIWTGVVPKLQEQIAAELERMSLDLEPTEVRIREFCAQVQANRRYKKLMGNRIRHLLEAGMGHLVTILGKDGRELATSLLLLSRENLTIYVLKTVHRAMEGTVPLALPLLLWRASQRLLDGVERLELGVAENVDQAQLLDRLGCELLPWFSAKT